MFDEQEIIQAVLRVANSSINPIIASAFQIFAQELKRVYAKKQQEWEKRHRVMTRDIGGRQ